MCKARVASGVAERFPPRRFGRASFHVFGAAGLLAALVVAAALESVAGLCLGCKAFTLLMRAGIVPESVCVECADLSRRMATDG